jgi:hypothetical protein
MEFSEKVLREAFSRSGGRCECRRASHKHGDQRCPRNLSWTLHGKDPEGWEAHLVKAGGPETAANCEVLCFSCFHAVTAE